MTFAWTEEHVTRLREGAAAGKSAGEIAIGPWRHAQHGHRQAPAHEDSAGIRFGTTASHPHAGARRERDDIRNAAASENVPPEDCQTSASPSPGVTRG
jgi:hypothetical protein